MLRTLLLLGISMSWLASCASPNPYLRDLKPDPADPRRVTIERAYLQALLADLEACYRQKSP